MLDDRDKIKFAELMQLLAKRFNQGRELDEIDLKSYWLALADEFDDIKEFEKAVIKLIKTWKYGRMPEPSYFIEAKRKFNDLEIEDISNKAWALVIEAVEKGVGNNKIADFEDPLIPYVVKVSCGGFERLARKWDLSDDEKKFKAYYRLLLKKGAKVEKVEVGCLVDNPKRLIIKAPYDVDNNLLLIESKREDNHIDNKVKNLIQAKRF